MKTLLLTIAMAASFSTFASSGEDFDPSSCITNDIARGTSRTIAAEDDGTTVDAVPVSARSRSER